jgi:hypothetical protein
MRARALAAVLFFAALLVPGRPALADPPVDSWQWLTCRPTQSYVHLGKHYQVKCAVGWYHPQSGQTITRFAIPTTDAAQVAQAMAVVHTAQIAGKDVRLLFRADATENPPGCDSDDCRFFAGIGARD